MARQSGAAQQPVPPRCGHVALAVAVPPVERFLPNLQSRRFWIESENRFIRLRLTTAGIRLIDKNGIDAVLADLRAAGTI